LEIIPIIKIIPILLITIIKITQIIIMRILITLTPTIIKAILGAYLIVKEFLIYVNLLSKQTPVNKKKKMEVAEKKKIIIILIKIILNPISFFLNLN
jgi:hypothetical protein